MREHLKDREMIARRSALKANQKKKMNEFFIHINSNLRVGRDRYNINLIKKRVSEEGNKYLSYVGHFSTLLGMLPQVAQQNGATDTDLERYKKRVKNIKVSYEDGFLNLSLPEDFKADPMDIAVEENK